MANVYKRVSGAWVVDNDYSFTSGGGAYTNGYLQNGYLRYTAGPPARFSVQTASNKGRLVYFTIPAGSSKKFKLTTVGLPYVYYGTGGTSAGQAFYDAPSPISTTQDGNNYIREYDFSSFIGDSIAAYIALTADHIQSSSGASNYTGIYTGEPLSGWGTGTIHQATNNVWS